MKTLRVRLCPLAELGAETPLDFEVLDERRRVAQTDRTVIGALPRLPRTELVVAAPDVLLIEATLPPLSGARLRAALQALAEPHILSEAANAHVAASKRASPSYGSERSPNPLATSAMPTRERIATPFHCPCP